MRKRALGWDELAAAVAVNNEMLVNTEPQDKGVEVGREKHHTVLLLLGGLFHLYSTWYCTY